MTAPYERMETLRTIPPPSGGGEKGITMKKRLTTVLIAAAVVSLVLSACRKNLLGGPLGGQ